MPSGGVTLAPRSSPGRERPIRSAGRAAAWLPSTLKIAAGLVLALLAAELGLRFFSTPLSNQWRPIAEDTPTGAVKEIRQYFEGIAASHYSFSRARLTGNPWLTDASVVVVLGDSFVEAPHVADEDTVGADLERMARAAGVRMNVRQYGWSGATPAKYVDVAADVISRWNPRRVVVLLNVDDLGPAVFENTPKFEIANDGGVRVVHGGFDVDVYRPSGALDTILRTSSLAYLLGRKYLEIRASGASAGSAPQPAPRGGTAIPDLVVDQLKRAYGERLTLVYLAVPGVDNVVRRSAAESALLDACDARRVDCYSTATEMMAAQTNRSRLVAGFDNTLPGAGHLNAAGYLVLAKELWSRTLGARVRP